MQPRLFQLGNDHLLLNGDSTDAEHLEVLHQHAETLNLGKAYIVFTDPPYGVNVSNHEQRKGSILKASVFTSPSVLNDNLTSENCMLLWLLAFQKTQKLFDYHKMLLFCAGSKIWENLCLLHYLNIKLRTLLLWIKNTRPLTRGEFAIQSECILYAGISDNIHRNKNLNQSNTFYDDVPSRTSTLPWNHPTAKPIKLLRDLLDATTIVGDVIIDPFAGTGSSLVACHRTGRKWLGIELDPKYCIAALMRWRYETAKQQPVYEIIDGERRELSDADLDTEFQQYKAQPAPQTA